MSYQPILPTKYICDAIPNPIQGMSKKKCPAFLPMCKDCGVDWQPCVGIENCNKSLTLWKSYKKMQTQSKNAGNGRKKGHTKKFLNTIAEMLEVMKKFNFEYVPTYKDLYTLGYDFKKIGRQLYRDYIKEVTGLPSKEQYYEERGFSVKKGGVIGHDRLEPK